MQGAADARAPGRRGREATAATGRDRVRSARRRGRPARRACAMGNARMTAGPQTRCPPCRPIPHPIIAREGWPFIAIAVAVALALLARRSVARSPRWPGSPSLFVVQFFRDPPRDRAAGAANAVLSPADGRIVKVERARDPYLDRDALKISVFMNVFNVHSQPQPGRRRGDERLVPPRRLRQRGARQGVARERAQRAAPRARVAGQDVTCVQVAGLDRAAHPLLREARRPARARPALRLHPLRLARRRLPAAGRRRRASRSATRSPRRPRSSPSSILRRVPADARGAAMRPTMADFDTQRALAEEPHPPARHLPAAQPVHDGGAVRRASTRSCRR